MKIMVWNAARGGMRSVVEAYRADGFLADEDVELVAAYRDGGFLQRQWLLLRALGRFVTLLLFRRPTLVHCHSSMRGSFWRKSLFATLAQWRGVPVVFHLHGSELKVFFASQPRWVQRLIVGRLESYNRIVVLSESWRDFVLGIAPRSRPVVVPNYVPLGTSGPRTGSAGHTLLFLGILGQRKGIYDLLQAVAALASRHPGLRLVAGGNGEIDKARAAAADLGIADRVSFEGWIGPDARAAHLAAADIYVLPSYNEGLPMSVLEAMAAGLPVVSTTVGGLPELLGDGDAGVLVAPGDVPALTAALDRLLADPSLRHRIGAAARERVEAKYSARVALETLRTVYRDLQATV